MRVLISGAGIAGLSLAICLERRGIAWSLVERSPALRDAGYMIDFFGPGYDAAEKLGLLEDLERIHYPVSRLVFLDGEGREKASVPYAVFRRLLDDRHFNFMRGDLERLLAGRLPESGDVRYGVTIASLRPGAASVGVEFSDGTAADFDVVVGADGVHSGVRALAFGEEDGFVRFIGYHTAAFILPVVPAALRDIGAFFTLTRPGRQVAVYPIRGGRLATFFLHRAGQRLTRTSFEAAREELRSTYGDMGWVVPALLEQCDRPTMYFDDVSQVVVPRWSVGRTVLLGDACQCVSLLAGQGASMAVAGAFVLADELASAGRDVPAALSRYEERLRPAIETRQAAGRRIARWFVPDTEFRIAVRNFVMRVAGSPAAGRLLKRFFAASGDVRL